MSTVPAFHSTLQAKKLAEHRIYHNTDRCFSGRDVALHERLEGDNGYRLCVECTRLSAAARPQAEHGDADKAAVGSSSSS
jgi:hypothetical protein